MLSSPKKASKRIGAVIVSARLITCQGSMPKDLELQVEEWRSREIGAPHLCRGNRSLDGPGRAERGKDGPPFFVLVHAGLRWASQPPSRIRMRDRRSKSPPCRKERDKDGAATSRYSAAPSLSLRLLQGQGGNFDLLDAKGHPPS